MASAFQRGDRKRYTVKFRHGNAWRTLPGYHDGKASDEMARKLDKPVSLRAERAALPAELAIWLQGLPERTRVKLAKWQLIDSRAVGSAKPLAQHLTAYY